MPVSWLSMCPTFVLTWHESWFVFTRPEICNHIINYACLVRSKNLIRVATSGLSYHVRHRLHIHLSIYPSIYLCLRVSIPWAWCKLGKQFTCHLQLKCSGVLWVGTTTIYPDEIYHIHSYTLIHDVWTHHPIHMGGFWTSGNPENPCVSTRCSDLNDLGGPHF